jgi:hypothetical protein
MKPVDFPNRTHVLAKDQDEYQNLPVCLTQSEFISCWQLTWFERLLLLITGRIWLRQLHHGNALQPQLPQVDDPFTPEVLDERIESQV